LKLTDSYDLVAAGGVSSQLLESITVIEGSEPGLWITVQHVHSLWNRLADVLRDMVFEQVA